MNDAERKVTGYDTNILGLKEYFSYKSQKRHEMGIIL